MSYRKKKRAPANPRQTVLTGMNADLQGVEELLSTGELYSGQPYQRPVLDRTVDKLVREWDPRLLTPLVVSYRDGRYNLVDGQHRVCAMRKKNGGKDVIALCRVYHGLTYEQEAELYYKLDRAKGHLRLSHATKALVESGADAEIIEIKRLLEGAGFVWALDKPTGEPFEVEATRAVINAYRLLGGAAFSRMLELTAQTWHGSPSSVKASFLSGMALFLKTYETELDDEVFVKRLSAVDPEEILRRGNTVKGKKYIYYHCPTGKKKGCTHPVMLKEADLIDCVLASLQAHIRHVVSLDELLDSISEEQINQEEIAKFKTQIADNEVKLEEARQFKGTLYENFISNLISKKDYQDLKNLYTGRAEQAQEAIDRLRAEMELVTNNSSSRLRWTQHFKEFSAMTTLDRRAVIAMVQSIRVEGKNNLVITFRYLIEYVKVLKRLDQMGKLPPDLRDVLDTLVAAEKEAA